MNPQDVIQKTADMIKTKFEGEGSGHDWWHIYRVWQLAKTISIGENADSFIVELAALLHDVADYKFNNGDEEIGGKVTKEWLKSLNVDNPVIEKVVYIVNNVSFKGGSNKTKMESIEGQVVQDADRLDAIGAIGIARVFAYGGNKGQQIYDPNIEPDLSENKEKYKNQKSTLNHFYEKLLLLKDLMNTNTGRQIAEQRHKYMQDYLNEFFAEWNGEK